jgi:hypothetical protein
MSAFLQKLLPPVRLAAVILLAGLCIFSAINGFQTAAKAAGEVSGDDMVTAWDKRLRKIRSLLPEYGVIGYAADWDIPGGTFGSSDQEVEFLLAQYTVAPVVLERGTNHSIILGNFSDNGDPNKLPSVQDTLGIRLTQPYSNEINIFEGTVK